MYLRFDTVVQGLSMNCTTYDGCEQIYTRGLQGLYKRFGDHFYPIAEWIHFTHFKIILPTIKPKGYTFGAYELSN